MSGQFAWSKDGALCSFVASPLKTKVWLPLLVLLPVLLEALLLELLSGRSNVQGTATSFSPVLEEPLLPLLVLALVLLDPVVLVPPDEDELSERIAKSTFPDCGFTTTSLIVPSVWPVDPWMFAPINWLARTS